MEVHLEERAYNTGELKWLGLWDIRRKRADEAERQKSRNIVRNVNLIRQSFSNPLISTGIERCLLSVPLKITTDEWQDGYILTQNVVSFSHSFFRKPFLGAVDTLGQFWARTYMFSLNWQEEVATPESVITIEIGEMERGEADVWSLVEIEADPRLASLGSLPGGTLS